MVHLCLAVMENGFSMGEADHTHPCVDVCICARFWRFLSDATSVLQAGCGGFSRSRRAGDIFPARDEDPTKVAMGAAFRRKPPGRLPLGRPVPGLTFSGVSPIAFAIQADKHLK